MSRCKVKAKEFEDSATGERRKENVDRIGEFKEVFKCLGTREKERAPTCTAATRYTLAESSEIRTLVATVPRFVGDIHGEISSMGERFEFGPAIIGRSRAKIRGAASSFAQKKVVATNRKDTRRGPLFSSFSSSFSSTTTSSRHRLVPLPPPLLLLLLVDEKPGRKTEEPAASGPTNRTVQCLPPRTRRAITSEARTHERAIVSPPRATAKLPTFSPLTSRHPSFDRSLHPSSTRPSANRRRRPRISRRPSAVSTWRLPAWFSDHGRALGRTIRHDAKGGGRDDREMAQGRS